MPEFSGRSAGLTGCNVRSMLFIILVVLLVFALGGTAPVWGHSRNWGYGPSGGIGSILLIVLCVWFFMGRA
jgi:hypothetical protein